MKWLRWFRRKPQPVSLAVVRIEWEQDGYTESVTLLYRLDSDGTVWSRESGDFNAKWERR